MHHFVVKFKEIFKIFFASGGKGALTPLTKTLRAHLHGPRTSLIRPRWAVSITKARLQLHITTPVSVVTADFSVY